MISRSTSSSSQPTAAPRLASPVAGVQPRSGGAVRSSLRPVAALLALLVSSACAVGVQLELKIGDPARAGQDAGPDTDADTGAEAAWE